VKGEGHMEGRWWKKQGKVEQLLVLAKTEGLPLYVYDEEMVMNQVYNLKKNLMPTVNRLFYAIKANSHPSILRFLYEQDFGFETVSVGEVMLIIKLFPNISPNRILYTPNFVDKEEFELPIRLGVHITLDSLHPLQLWPDIWKGVSLAVRIDPLLRRGHHDHVKTAGKESKFGLALADMALVPDLVKSVGAKVKGFHSHVGSGILKESDTWGLVAEFFAQFLDKFPDVEFFDLGGGLGVVERPDQQPLDLTLIRDGIEKFKRKIPSGKKIPEIWIEPGRYIVAESGVLLCKVTQWKRKGDTFYVGVNTGFNTLIRPILYSAWHNIVNLSKWDGKDDKDESNNNDKWIKADVVGIICESGDVLGHDRRIRKPDVGDVMLIDTVGAYGRSMSLADYNLREPAKEFWLRKRNINNSSL